jgi:hypothetical protein
MKITLSSLKIEGLKVSIAAISLLSFILISRLLGSDFLVVFAYLQALIVIVSSLYDRGLNVSNLNVEIRGVKFISAKQNHYHKLLGFILFICLFVYVFNSSINTSHILIAIVVCTPFNVFLMRWNTVLKREGKLHQQIFYGEFIPAILRLSSVFAGLIGDIISFIYFLALAPVLSCLLCLSKVKVVNLFVFKKSRYTKEKAHNIEHYLLSVFAAVKNQLFGFIIPFIPMHLQASFVVISRVYGVVVILFSGVFARIPLSISLYKRKEPNNVFIYYLSVSLGLICLLISSSFWLPFIGNVFEIVIKPSFSELLLLTLVMFGIFISLNSLILQALARVKLALLLEIFYMVLFILGVTYVESIG